MPGPPRNRTARVVAGLLALATFGAVTASASIGPANASVGGVQVTSVSGVTGVTATAKAPHKTSEQRLAARINTARKAHDRKPLKVVAALSAVAEKQARRMATKQTLYHNPHLTSDVHKWVAIGENVAYDSSVKKAHKMLMNSPGHRANLLSKSFTQVGLGVVKDGDGTYWVCEVFRKP